MNPNSDERLQAMNMLQTGGNFNGPVTMSSREIADLCGKQHDNVMRDIRKMLHDIGQDALNFEGMYSDAYGREKPCFNLPKDLTITLITGYRADLRYKVVKRMEELEGRGAVTLSGPQLMAAALIEADATMKAQAARIEAMKEDVEAHARLSKAEGSLNITEAAKNLGMRPGDLFDWLAHNGWIYKRPGSSNWLGYAPRCNSGDLWHKSTTVLRADGSEKISEQVRITPQGLAKLAKLIFPTAKLIGGAA